MMTLRDTPWGGGGDGERVSIRLLIVTRKAAKFFSGSEAADDFVLIQTLLLLKSK